MKRALLIGINYYGTSSQLSGCIDDIDDMAAHLVGIGYTDITLLRDTPSPTEGVLTPTREHIIGEMESIIKRSKAGDTVFIQYSGHGAQLADDNSDEADGFDECICPVDFDFSKPDEGFIRDDLLSGILVRGLPHGVKLRVAFDSCHSGTALDAVSRVDGDIIFFSGCRDGQTSADASFNGRANGALTYYFLRVLKKYHAAGGSFKWTALLSETRAGLAEAGYDQVPQLTTSGRSSFVDIC